MAIVLACMRENYYNKGMADKDFIKENIVGRGDSRKKMFRHYFRVLFSAALFGVISAAVFAVSEPFVGAHVKQAEETVEEVTLLGGEDEPEATEQTIPVTEEVLPTDAIEDVVQSEMEHYPFSIDSYNTLIANLAELASGADNAVVEVKSIGSGTDFFGNPLEAADVYAGVVIATTADEVLILTSDQAVSNAESIQVTLKSGSVLQGSLKGIDRTDGISVVALSVSSMLQNELDQLHALPLGNSNQIRRGDAVVAVGAPAGVAHSSAYGFVSFVASNYGGIDLSQRVLVSDVAGNARAGTFLLNTKGELVGWVSTKFGEGESDGYVRVAGLSDFKAYIERLSNGENLPYFGISTQEVSRSMENSGLPAGIYVRSCGQDTPAYQAGIQSGDIVTEINGAKVSNMKEYKEALAAVGIGAQTSVKVLRQSGDTYREIAFQVTAGSR